MRSTMFLAALALPLVGCAMSTEAFLSKQEGFRITAGYVIKLEDLKDPKVTRLTDGTAYTVTQEGCSLVMEFGNPSGLTRRRPRREVIELAPGDVFVQSRPFSFALQRPKAAAAPPEPGSPPDSAE